MIKSTLGNFRRALASQLRRFTTIGLTFVLSVSCLTGGAQADHGKISNAQTSNSQTSNSQPSAKLSDKEQLARLIVSIRKADYENDLAALHRLDRELEPFANIAEVAPYARYWQGFALWRAAINGFNDEVKPEELKTELAQAIVDFRAARALEPAFVDAQIGEAGCEAYLIFLYQNDPAEMKKHIVSATELVQAARTSSPNNPRLLWLLGSILWNSPPSAGASQEKAMETYQQGLKAAREKALTPVDTLHPSWGEAELLMNIAWSKAHASSPDLKGAQQDAEQALKLAPNWHYVRDLLLPQIQEAQQKAPPESR